MKYWIRTNLPVGQVRRRAMLYFGKEAAGGMTLVSREADRLLFSDPEGDLIVRVDAGQPNTVSIITTHCHGEAQEFLKRLAESGDGAIHYETESDQAPQEILRRAREYFGQTPEGLGLALSAEQPQSLEFTGGGGQVTVAVRTNGRPLVHVAALEWGYHAEQFVRQVSSER